VIPPTSPLSIDLNLNPISAWFGQACDRPSQPFDVFCYPIRLRFHHVDRCSEPTMIKQHRFAPASTLFLALRMGMTPFVAAQDHQQDYEDVDPWVGYQSARAGADSATAGAFLSALASTTPAVCQLAIRSIRNHWGNRGGR
jgi:hypothetical protein